MNDAIIVDIDGTIANISHRRKYVESKPKDWKKFNEMMYKDTVNEWCKILVGCFEHYHVILVTGRHEEFRNITEMFLQKYDIAYDELFMRKDGDYRDDSIIKKEIYDEHIKGRYNILFAVDDRQRIVDMWRENGLVCLQCDNGNF